MYGVNLDITKMYMGFFVLWNKILSQKYFCFFTALYPITARSYTHHCDPMSKFKFFCPLVNFSRHMIKSNILALNLLFSIFNLSTYFFDSSISIINEVIYFLNMQFLVVIFNDSSYNSS